MTDNNKGRVWQNLDWAKKVGICMQGIDHEDSLLTTFVVIFIALEAMFFAVVFSMKLSFCFNLIIAILAILVAGNFAYLFKRRGDYVDHWGAILYALWKGAFLIEESESEVSASELMKHYEGCFERRKRGRFAIIFGWGSLGCRLKSPRLCITTFTPILVILVWIVIVINQVMGILDC